MLNDSFVQRYQSVAWQDDSAVMVHSSSMGQFAPSSPVPAGKLHPAKSPRLLRIFHRRWQSSSAIKVPLNLDDPLPSPSGSVPSTPVHGSSTHQMPKKLYLYSSLEVAEELCVMDGELLRKIDPEELSNGAWMKKSKDSLAPNVIAMIRSFNQLALLVPSEILEETTPQARAKVITSYIQIASKCHRLRNYNSLKAVLAGLQCTPIFRLKKTWKEVPSKKRKRFDQLSELMSEEDNCQVYQTEIEKLLKSESSFIPFLGSFLTQIVHQVSYDEIRAKHEKSKSSTASMLSNSSEASQPTSPSRQIVLREATGVEIPNLTDAAVRRRSCSLSGTAVNSTTALLEQLKEEEGINLSRSAPSSPVPSHCGSLLDRKRKSSSSSTCEEDGSLHAPSSTATAASALASSIDAMTKNIVAGNGDDEVDWVGCSENSLADHDSGLYSSSSHRSASLPKSSSLNSLRHDTDEEGERCSSATALAGGSEVDLKDVYFRLKRKSQSYESLLDAYTEEDTGLKKVLHSTLTELARLSANLDGDSVFSESDDTGENDTSLINLDLTFSEHCSESSLHHSSFDASASSNGHMIQELRAALDKEDSETPTTITELIAKQQRPKLLRAQSEQTSLEAKLKNLERLEKAQDIEEANRESENELQSQSEVVIESQEGKREKEEKKKRPVRRSLSYSKAVLKRRRRKKSSSVCENHSVSTDQEKSAATEPVSPAEMLNQFKIASIGCSVGLENRSALRGLIRDTQPNTEGDNYKLSVDREQ